MHNIPHKEKGTALSKAVPVIGHKYEVSKTREELDLQDRYRFKVVNDDLERAVQEIEQIIQENAPTNEK